MARRQHRHDCFIQAGAALLVRRHETYPVLKKKKTDPRGAGPCSMECISPGCSLGGMQPELYCRSRHGAYGEHAGTLLRPAIVPAASTPATAGLLNAQP
jgi:hypothetical protein